MTTITKDARDVAEKLSAKLTHARTFLAVTYGDGAEAFEAMTPIARGNYLWGVGELVRECEVMADALNSAIYMNAKELVVSLDKD